MSYWGAVANTPSTHLPRDFVDGINTVASTRTVSVVLGQEDTRALLQEIPEVYHTQINDVLLAALVDVLAQWSRQETICLNLEGHGREELLEDIDLSRTVGWFTSIFPVVLKRGHPWPSRGIIEICEGTACGRFRTEALAMGCSGI